MALSENFKRIREEIRETEKAAGRPEGAVRLIAVSKTKPIEMLEEAWALGQRVFGENHVQEIVEKKDAVKVSTARNADRQEKIKVYRMRNFSPFCKLRTTRDLELRIETRKEILQELIRGLIILNT